MPPLASHLSKTAASRPADASLPTVYADEHGNLRPTERKTRIDIYRVWPGEVASGILELSIPVVETGNVLYYDVRQRVPLPISRSVRWCHMAAVFHGVPDRP